MLTENRRQEHAWERAALEHLRAGETGAALSAYGQHDRITHARDRHEALDQLVSDWHARRDIDGTVMIAHFRRDVAELNARARAVMRAVGALGAAEIGVCGLRFAAGDRIVLRRNDHRLDVRNGDRGAVTAVDPAAGTLTVRIGAAERTLPRAYLNRPTRSGDPSIQHGYGITAYVAQGLTCRTALVLVHDDADREWAYTVLSRGREHNQLYTVSDRGRDRHEFAPASPGRSPGERLAAALQRSRQQQLATDHDVLRIARSHDELEQLRARRQRHRSADRDIGLER